MKFHVDISYTVVSEISARLKFLHAAADYDNADYDDDPVITIARFIFFKKSRAKNEDISLYPKFAYPNTVTLLRKLIF